MSIFLDISNYFSTNLPYLYYLAVFMGAATLLPYFLTIIHGLYKLLFRKRISFKKRYGEGAWALVTGSSQGIGKELASQLAKEGLNILLLARTESKLKQAQQQLQTAYPSIKVAYIVADLAKQGRKQNIDQVLPELNKYDLSILVNNAGVDILGQHSDLPVNVSLDLISINCFALGALTYKYLHLFKQKIKNTGKHCAILNVSSVAGNIPLPLQSVYSGSKAYVDKLTLNIALQNPQIDWMVLRPSEVSTSMTCFKNLDIFTITAKQCATGTFNDFLHDRITNGHISHKIQDFIYSMVPLPVFHLLWMKVFGPQFLEERQKFYELQKKGAAK